MSSPVQDESPASLKNSQDILSTVGVPALSQGCYAAIATSLALIGLSTIWPTLCNLWILWTTDAMKSIGMAAPPVSLFLVLRAWKGLGWRAKGTWWSLALVVISAMMARIQEKAILILVISPNWSTIFPPPSLVLLTYCSGAVLLFGGVKLYRAALFPMLLLWFANPIPHVFTLLVDLPLQTISAHLARAFAMSLGHSLTPDHLRLMFTPEFGMFIAPGCDGIRGSVTMGFIALVAGYIYKFRWHTNALVVVGSIILGYVFNLLRLCLLVLYYIAALHLTWLQDKAETADYLIGGALFLLATLLLFTIIHRLRDAEISPPDTVDPLKVIENGSSTDTRYARLGAMGVMAILGCIGVAHTSNRQNFATQTKPPQFPSHLGTYNFLRAWTENLPTGPVVYYWARYAGMNGSASVDIGISPVLGWHDPIICHVIRGEQPLWQGPLTFISGAGTSVQFSSAFYSNEVVKYLEASTQCVGSSCSEYATDRTHFGFIYTRPDPSYLLGENLHRSLPVLIRIESMDVSIPANAARPKLTDDLRDFFKNVNLYDLTAPYGK